MSTKLLRNTAQLERPYLDLTFHYDDGFCSPKTVILARISKVVEL